jgi:hypothetical protein
MDFVRAMRRHGVAVVDRARGEVRCLDCRETWAVKVTSKRRVEDGSWLCPRGCNATS